MHDWACSPQPRSDERHVFLTAKVAFIRETIRMAGELGSQRTRWERPPSNV